MILRDIFKKQINEGGNQSSHKDDGTPMPGWQGIPGVHQAQELDLRVHDRSYVVEVLSDLLHKINNLFAQQFKEPLWHENSVEAQKFLSGSTARFFDKKISDEEFVRVKPTVGDIDTQAPDKHAETIKQFLTSLIGKKVGDVQFIGFGPGNSQYSSMWQVMLKDLPVKLQIDFEYGKHDSETGLPTEWQDYSHSSSWEDLSAGIKGVFHKYIDRALPYASSVTTKYVARVLRTSTKISPTTVTDSDYSFAVSGPGGGGVSRKYIPYNDPETGEPMEKDGIPVMQLLEPANRQYIQNLAQQFEIFFGQKPNKQDQQLKNSFIGTVELSTKYLDDAERTELFRRFVGICFEPGSQMITKNDPVRDRDTKMAAIDYMIEHLGLPNAQALRKEAINTAMAYEQAFTTKKAAKAPAPLAEAEVKAQLRKGMPHLRDLKAPDFLDLLDEISDGNGRFKLQNIPLNVKVDGFGGRFGKNADGKPFMGTSRTEPRYQAGFVAYHQQKGTTDPDVLGRAQLFDDLFEEMMNAVQLVDSKLGPDFLVNKQVTCEVLYLPFATETDEGKLKFVGIHYDKLPEGVQLALVPFRVTDAGTGEDLEDSNNFIKQLLSVGSSGSVMFIDNSLTQKEGLDVTELINPLDNIEQLKQIVSDTSGKRDRISQQLKREVEEKLQPIKLSLEKAIIEDPNIIGKDILGKDYEGIVINSRLGPIKVTSQEQKQVIADKNAAKANARTERPRGESKTAVVAIGSFVGHRGHEDLFKYTIDKAKELGGDPYLFIGNAEGKDDPIPPAVKVQTWHKLYPEYANNISTVQAGGSLIQKVKHELINPLPGKPPRYDNIVIMVGEDRAGLTMPAALMKAVNKFLGYEHVEVRLEVTPRESGFSGTMLRNSLKNDSPEQALAVWSNAFDVKKLGKDWILHLMDITKKGMGIAQQPAVQQPAPVAERLSTALIRPRVNEVTFKKSPYGRTAASQQRAKELLNPPKPPEPKKDDKANESDNPWGDQGNFAGDKPVNIGGDTVKQLGVGDIVSYLGQKAKIEAQSKDRKYSRITIFSNFGGTTKDVLTSDLKRLGGGVAEDVDIGQEWMSDTELDQYVPQQLQQQWRELLGYDRNGNPSALWANLTGGYEPDVNDPQHRVLMVKVANKWFAAKKIPNVKFFDVKDADDELEWLVQIGEQGVAEGLNEFAMSGSDDDEDDKYTPQDFGKPFKANYLGQNKFEVFCRKPQDPSNVIKLNAEVQKYGLEWEENFGFWFLDSPGAVYLSWKYGEIPLPKAIDQARNLGHIHDLVTDYLTNSPHAAEIQKIATEYFGFTMDGDMNEGLNEFAQGDFNGSDDSNDLQLYLNVAKKLNMKKYKPSTAHDLIAKKMAELVDAVDDEKVDWARHMARKAQGLPSMLDQQGVAEGKCVPISEDVQNIMDALINKIIVNEAIQNNKR